MRFLICRTNAKVCGFALSNVVEVMRMMPIEGGSDAAPFVMGTSRIRGQHVPVVSAGRLLGETQDQHTRLVSMTFDGSRFAIAVDAVDGVAQIPDSVATAASRFPAPAGGPAAMNLARLLSAAIVLDAGEWRAISARLAE